MQGNRRRDTQPELAVRRLLHGSGYRYRVDWPLPFDRRRRADIAFTKDKLVIFVDGCYWHRCPQHYVAPRTNSEFWDEKTLSNQRRDLDTDRRLAALGWTVLRFWEHADPELEVLPTIVRTIQAARDRRSSGTRASGSAESE